MSEWANFYVVEVLKIYKTAMHVVWRLAPIQILSFRSSEIIFEAIFTK